MTEIALSRLSINQATTRSQWSLLEAIDGYARHEIAGIGIWRDKLHDCGTTAAIRKLKDSGLSVSSLCRGGMFPYDTAVGKLAVIDENLRAIEEAAELGAKCLVLVCGGLPGMSKDIVAAREQVAELLADILPYARAAQVSLAIEPLHPMYAADRSCINSLAQANALCDELGDGVGVAIDAYHVWWDPDLSASVAASTGRILGYHVCDWKRETNHLLLDRGMMGDGVIDLPGLSKMVGLAGYTGPVEVEIFSAQDYWLRDADEVVALAKFRFMAFC